MENTARNLQEMSYTTKSGNRGYVYITDEALHQPYAMKPLVLVMTYTTGEARDVVKQCKWDSLAEREGLILIAPDYDNYATYSETSKIMDGICYAIEHYPVDTERVYSTGFSNGGAASVAMVSRYPRVFAAISAMGWMVDMRGQDDSFDIPFQVIQGTCEYTQTINGHPAIMDDERAALRSLFRHNEMPAGSLCEDYGKTPYWGFEPDEVRAGSSNGDTWTISNYYKEGFDKPFAQLVLIDGAGHTAHRYEARLAWNFMKNFKRTNSGIQSTGDTNLFDFSKFANVDMINAHLDELDDEQKAVLFGTAKYCQAMTEADIDTMRSLIAPDTVFVHMSGMQQTREEYLADVARGRLRYYRIGIDTPVVEVTGNSASVAYTSILNANAYGAKGTYRMKGTHWYKKQGDMWVATNKPH